jgi:phosphoribosylformimino-5-aminoimidazole carboxamide ribotide isomerase
MAVTFQIVPAIDLRGGRVVRLVEGDFGRETSFGDDPAAVGESFAAAGARMLHIVDLDGARAGRPLQSAVIRDLLAELQGRVDAEVAGGLRTPRDVADALAAGAARAVVGTAALRETAFAEALVRTHGADRIAVALDVRNGLAIGEGWRPGATGTVVVEALRRLHDVGVETFEVTAIERDGRLEGPNLDLLERLVALRTGNVIASGGVRSIADLRRIRDIGCSGAIVGRALYEGSLDLRGAIEELGRDD